MNSKSNNIKNASIALTIILISLVTIVPIVTNLFNQTSNTNTTNIIIDQIPSQSPLPTSLTVINETKNQNTDNFSGNLSSASTDTVPIYTETSKSTSNIQAELTRFFLTLSNSPITSITTVPFSLNASNFVTYTYYYGYPVQHPDSAQFLFSFPDKINQGQISGSDAFSCDTFTIQKMAFDAVFNTPKTNAIGFDEMVIFATSDPISYKGIEFGVRMDLSDGFIYGYIQEPNGNYGEVSFQMLKLIQNDGIMHHFTAFISGSEISFFIDGISYGYLNFSASPDYSTLTFTILAVVHRFTDNWDSTGDNMTVENFLLNQQ